MKKLFIISTIFSLFLLWYGVDYLSYSFVDIHGIENFKILKYVLDVSFFFLGKNDFALRLPGIIVFILNIFLFFKLSFFYLKKEKDRIYATALFMLIPGVIISALIVNKSIYIIFITLLFIYLYKKKKILAYLFLVIPIFLDYSFISLYFALIFYAIYKKDNALLLLSLIFLAINANYFNYTIGGKPKGHFLDLFGTYFLIFSPFVFVYFLFSLYKAFFDKSKDILFFITLFTFLISIILSFRQKIRIDDYAPFTVVYVLYMVKYFLNSYRVRLPEFKKPYKILFLFLFISLMLFDTVLFLNRYTPARKLSDGYYYVKSIAKELKKRHINYIKCNDEDFCKFMHFYGLKFGNKYSVLLSKNKKEVSIFHKNRKLYNIDVSKLNTL